MKTLVKNGVSIYLLDNKHIEFTNTSILIGDPLEFVISDCSNLDTSVYDCLDFPDDWIGGKYLFDGFNWALNPNWQEPQIRERRTGKLT